MEKKVLKYRVIIEPEKLGRKTVYNAYCPTLGLADYADTVEQAYERIQKLVRFHVESLIKDNQPIPYPDQERTLVSLADIKIEVPLKIAFA